MKIKLLFASCFLALNILQAQIIKTVAGGGLGHGGDGGQATAAGIGNPIGLTFDAVGNMYIVDDTGYKIRKVNTAGIISTVAGTGVSGYSGDGGPATAAKLSDPKKLVVDAAGNLYISDLLGYRIRKVNTAGVITTFAGTGAAGYNGDGGQASAANLSPTGLAIDVAGNLYVADCYNFRVRVINTAGIISTVVGNGIQNFTGDGGQATDASLNYVDVIAVDGAGNLYITDTNNSRVRKVNTAGVINTIAGGGPNGLGNGGQATNATLTPSALAVDAIGNVYIGDAGANTVCKIDQLTGIITTVAGDSTSGFSGDGGPATAAQLHEPYDICIDATGNVFIADFNNDRVREMVMVTTGIEQVSAKELDVYVYPNPCNGNATVFSEKNIDELKVIDMLGQIVYREKPKAKKTALQVINEGSYFISITCGKETSMKKIIVLK